MLLNSVLHRSSSLSVVHLASFTWNPMNAIYRDLCYYKHRVKEAIPIRLHPVNINSDGGIEIPEAWMSTIKKHNNKKPCDSGPPREQITTRIEMHQSELLKKQLITAEHHAL